MDVLGLCLGTFEVALLGPFSVRPIVDGLGVGPCFVCAAVLNPRLHSLRHSGQ